MDKGFAFLTAQEPMTNDAGSPIPGSCQRKSLDELLARDWSASPLGPVHSWPIELICTLRTIFEASSPYFLAWGPDLICFWNDAYARILAGRSAKMGQRFQEVWPEAWAIVGPIAHAALAGKSSYFEHLPLRLILDGEPQQTWWTFGYSPVPLATGEVGGVLATLVDQTKRVALEREIEEERQASYRFRDLMPDLLWEADGAGNVRYMNIAMRDYLGLDPAAASNWTDYIHPDDVPVIIKNLADAEERQGLFESQHRIRRKDGEYRWMLARSQPIVEGANGIVGWYGCASDIHDLLPAQDAVVQSRELLQLFADSTTQLM